MAETERSVQRILDMKQRFAFTEAEPAGLGLPGDRAAAERMVQAAVAHAGGPLFTADARTFFCGCRDWRTSLAVDMSAEEADFPRMLGQAFGAPYLVTSDRPDEAEIRQAVKAAEGCGSIVMCTCNARMRREQLALAEVLAALGKPMIAVALRDPYDLAVLPEDIGRLAAWEYSPAAIRAVIRVLQGGACTGVMPVRTGEDRA